MAGDLEALLIAHPELSNDNAFQALQQKQKGASGGLTAIGNGLDTIQKGLYQLIPSVNQITGGLGQLADGQTKAASGAAQLETGFGQLAKGLGDGTNALGKASDGIGQIRQAQQGIVDNGGKQISGWYLPKEVLETSEDLKKSLDAYVSPDGKTTKLEAILKINPYSKEAMATIDTLRSTIKQSINGSVIQNADVKLTGTTAQDRELDLISKQDFLRTGGLVLIGIYVVLAIMLGSVLSPLYILLSLVFNYYITMGLVEFIFVKLLGFTGLSWTVSFFVFLIIVALGVDYSIFLMARFKEEYRQGGVVVAIQRSMSTTGGVIMSAAVIMGGTFAAFLYSGVHTLEQIGAGIVIGLALYTTVFMGFIVPALVTLFGEANWWPSNRLRNKRTTKTTAPADVIIKPTPAVIVPQD
jgi:RND superfamily putative drug exporter